MAEPTLKPGVPTAQVTPAADPANIFNLQLSTGGTVSVLLRPDVAPNSVERIKTLIGRHFYDGTSFHRVIDGFMAQGGDPKGTGEGGSDLPDLKAEFNDLPHVRGAMAMARADSPDSANSQFYIMLAPNLTLDRKYTVVGRVIAGMAQVDLIEKGEPPANPTKVVRAWMGQPPAVAASPPVAQAASSAAATAAADQAAEAAIAADDAAVAARQGKTGTARNRAAAARMAAGGAAQAAADAAEAAGQSDAKPPRRR
ncbi:peptidylprolyl isomerase [uncultured Sphingomonas sp.]|uniref:peptidylprolyl isomerase n=1 Tax=uncultured Sphingomonas sp. TaxID=158754 RepID=UPI0025FD09FF|nr:peptidylprolyl isomerase [uncultured Sphingomonas sp.]